MNRMHIDENKFENIVKILEANEQGVATIQMSPFKNNINIRIEGKDTELYIKKSIWGYVISRVHLENQRIGTMTKIVEEIKKISIEEECKEIVIESVMTEAMYGFCCNRGFDKVKALDDKYDIFKDVPLFGNYKYDL